MTKALGHPECPTTVELSQTIYLVRIIDIPFTLENKESPGGAMILVLALQFGEGCYFESHITGAEKRAGKESLVSNVRSCVEIYTL